MKILTKLLIFPPEFPSQKTFHKMSSLKLWKSVKSVKSVKVPPWNCENLSALHWEQLCTVMWRQECELWEDFGWIGRFLVINVGTLPGENPLLSILTPPPRLSSPHPANSLVLVKRSSRFRSFLSSRSSAPPQPRSSSSTGRSPFPRPHRSYWWGWL